MSKVKDLLITKDFLEIVAHGIAGGCFVNATREEIVAGAAYELTDLVLKASPSLDAGPLRAVAELMAEAMLAQHLYNVKSIARSLLMDDLATVPPAPSRN